MTSHKKPVAMKKGGCATKKYAKGGSVKHDDTAVDKKLIKAEIKKAAVKHVDAPADKKLIKAELKKAGVKPVKLAAGGSAKQRQGFPKTIAPKKK